MSPYAPRAFRFIELLTIGDWRMKLYGIATHGDLPRAELIAAAKKIAREQLARETADNYGVGFIGVHDGRGAAFVFVDFGETKTNCSIAFFFRATTTPKSWLRQAGRFVSVCLGSPSPII